MALRVGDLIRYESRTWRVGLVNSSRARLDPISGYVQSSVNTGKPFIAFGGSVSVGNDPSIIDYVDVNTLSDAELLRLERLEREAQVADQQAAKSKVAPPPIAGGGPLTKGSKLKELNDQRREKLAEIKANKAASRALDAANRSSAQGSAEKNQVCKCGCGGATFKFFFPGHDARFKGWLLKIERGKAKKEDLLSAEVIAQYEWRKHGDGEIPTLNYKGEPHSGYEPLE